MNNGWINSDILRYIVEDKDNKEVKVHTGKGNYFIPIKTIKLRIDSENIKKEITNTKNSISYLSQLKNIPGVELIFSIDEETLFKEYFELAI